MTRYTCKNTAVFSISEWTDNEQNTKFYDLYINGKFLEEEYERELAKEGK